MKARARIVAAPDGRGGTRLVEVYGEAPLLPRRTGPGQVHLVGGAAGPLGGDQLRLEITVEDGACLTVRTVAACVVLPGPGPSTLDLVVRVGAGAALHWLPEPQVAAAGCDHLTRSSVELAASARLVWREELVLGRSGEAPGDVRTSLHVRHNRRALLHQDLAAGPRAAGYGGAAVFGDARTHGSILVVDPDWAQAAPAELVTEDGARLVLPGPAVLATALAPDGWTLRERLSALIAPDTMEQRVLHRNETMTGDTFGRPATPAGRA
jgi:urease accessory protein